MLRLQLPLPERYTDASDEDLESRIAAAEQTLGERLFTLGHHYQRDEIIQFADARGDSYRLSVLAQERPQTEYIVFCGMHFMAESADILTADHQQVSTSCALISIACDRIPCPMGEYRQREFRIVRVEDLATGRRSAR